MAVLHVTEHGASVNLRAGRIVVSIDGHVIADFPARKVHGLVVSANARLTTPLVRFLVREGASILYLDTVGRVVGRTVGESRLGPDRLRGQFAAAGTPTGLEIARSLVAAKFANSVRVLEEFGVSELVRSNATQLRKMVAQVSSVTNLNALRGLEGIGARKYFESLGDLLGPFGFSGRNRRPPRDPVNAALSYGYALLHGRVAISVDLAGMHPEVGFLHAESRRNPALVLDLMEPFRAPVVDRLVIMEFLHGNLAGNAHFDSQLGAVSLNSDGKRRLVTDFEKLLLRDGAASTIYAGSLSDAIVSQTQALAQSLVRNILWKPFIHDGDAS